MTVDATKPRTSREQLSHDIEAIAEAIPESPKGFARLREMHGLLPSPLAATFPNQGATGPQSVDPNATAAAMGNFGIPGNIGLGMLPGSALTPGSVDSGALGDGSYASGLQPVYLVAALPTLPDAHYPVNAIVFNTGDQQLYKNVANVWTKIVNTTDLAGTISGAQIASGAVSGTHFASGIQPVNLGAVNPTLPNATYPTGSFFYNTGSGLLYKNVANVWVTLVNAGDLTGQVGTSQISAGAITAALIAADTITAGQIAAGAITASELAANAVTAGKIAAGTIVAADIAANTITAAKIAAATITSNELAANSIIAGKIAAGAVTATEIAAGTITTAKLSVGGIDIGTIAQAFSITNGAIAANAISASNIQANSIDAGKITAGGITADVIIGGTISSSHIETGGASGWHIFVRDSGGSVVGAWTSGGAGYSAITLNGSSGYIKANFGDFGDTGGGSPDSTTGVRTAVVAGIGSSSGVSGKLAIDSSSGAFGRFYGYHSGGWHYVAFTAGFEVPAFETRCPVCEQLLKPGDDLIGVGDRWLPDGALHGLWKHLACAGKPNGRLADQYAAAGDPKILRKLVGIAKRMRKRLG